jgi:hypothetical protein
VGEKIMRMEMMTEKGVGERSEDVGMMEHERERSRDKCEVTKRDWGMVSTVKISFSFVVHESHHICPAMISDLWWKMHSHAFRWPILYKE